MFCSESNGAFAQNGQSFLPMLRTSAWIHLAGAVPNWRLQQKLLQNWSKVIACHRMSSWVGQVGLLLETLRDLRPRCVQAAHASASSLVDESRVGSRRSRGHFYSKPPTSEHHLNALQLIQQSYPFRSFRSFHLDAANGTCLTSGSHLALGNIWLIAPSSPCAQQPGSSASGLRSQSNVKSHNWLQQGLVNVPPWLGFFLDITKNSSHYTVDQINTDHGWVMWNMGTWLMTTGCSQCATFPDFTSSATAWATKFGGGDFSNLLHHDLNMFWHLPRLPRDVNGQTPWDNLDDFLQSCHTFEHRDKLQHNQHKGCKAWG